MCMVENELKYVIRWNEQLENDLKSKYGFSDIEQAYLNDRTRLRRKSSFKHEQFIFTFKQRIHHGRNIEIETAISADDYYELIKFSTERLLKKRVSVRQDDVQWDIDFPQWPTGKHFILAEAEMPAVMDDPPYILEELRPHLVYAVPRHDGRFTSRRMINENHVIDLARELGLLGFCRQIGDVGFTGHPES